MTALWSGLKHVGREDTIPFFDRVFNAQGDSADRWPYHLDRPIRWDRTGQESRDRDRQTRSKLMESLQLSSQDLDALVTYLSGTETILELDTAYLTRLYQLARLPKVLRLTVAEFLVLLTLMEKAPNQAPIGTLPDVLALSDRVAWMQRTGISVAELIFFEKSVATDHADLYSETDLRTLAKQLRDQASDILVSGESFTTTEITEAQSLAIFQFLQDSGWVEVINTPELSGLSAIQQRVQALAAVRRSPSELSELLTHLATAENWIGEFDTLKAELDGLRTGLGDLVLQALIEQGLLSQSGLVSRQQPDSFSDDSLLLVLPERDRNNADVLKKRDRLRAWLEQRVERQNQIESTVHTTLTRLSAALPEAILQGLADMFEVSTDLVSTGVDYLSRQTQGQGQTQEKAIDAIAFITQIYTLQTVDSQIPPSLSVYVAKLVKLLYLLAKFEFSVADAQTFLNNPELLLRPATASSPLTQQDLLQPSLANLDRLAYFQQLKTDFKDETRQLMGVLSLGALDLSTLSANDPKIQQLTELTGWEPRQLITLAAALGGNNHNQIEVLNRLQQGFALAQSIGSDVDFLIQLSDTDQLDYAFYRQQAAALLKVLRASYSEDDWPKVYKPIRNQLAVQKRDALLAMAMKQLPADFAGRQDPDILYEYFLLDMQIGSEVDTSRIVQATASLQLYVQHCLMNLEAGVDPDTIPLAEWEWVKNYRVWEANRKIFLYPENYIEPELRRTKTPLFEELEQTLLQADINQAAVETAYITYLDQFAELAKLKIVGSYLHRELAGDPNPGDETLYLIGRTDTQPRIYYLRRHIKTQKGERWLPWEKIDVAINSDFATPVYAFGKLLLFWTEFTKLKESQDQRLSQQIRNKYSTDLLNGVFKPPQITSDDIKNIESLARYVAQGTSSNSSTSIFLIAPILNRLSKHFDYVRQAFINSGFRVSAQVSQAVAKAQQEIGARRDLEAALIKEEITRLERQEWTVDSEGYLFDTRIVGRVQKNVDVYKTVVKYSYYNLSKTWIPPQTHLETQLSEAEYQQIKWHSLYAQRAYQFVPTSGSQSPQQETNPQVLQIDENTQLAAVVPRFNMERLTGSFWLKPVSVSPQGHQGSIATDLDDPLKDRTVVTQEALAQSLSLLNYDNGSLEVTATNNVSAIAGAQTREDNVRAAVPLTQAALQLSQENKFGEAAQELAKIKTTPITEIPEAIRKTAAAITAQQEATSARTEATNARTEATSARNAATAAAADAPNKAALAAAAAQKEAEAAQKESTATQKEQAVPARQNEARAAIQAAHTASQAQLLIEVDAPKWESKALTLTVQLGDPDQTLTATLAMDVWQHIALTLEETVENQVNGYRVKLIRHQQGGAEQENTKFLKSVRLAQRELLEIGRQAATNPVFDTQMAEFRLWSQLRPKSDIQAERLQRKVGEPGLFSLPLNVQIPSSNMTLVPTGELTFTMPIAFEGELSERLAEDRERIIIFYGDKIRSIRNNLEEQSFELTLDRQTSLKNYDVSLKSHKPTEAVLSLTQTDGLFVSDFASTDSTSILALPESTTDTQNFIIRKLQNREVSFLDVHNRPGWYIADTGDDQFLMRAVFLDADNLELSVPTATELMQVQFNNAANTSNDGAQAISISFGLQADQAPVVSATNKVEFQFERLSTYAIHQLSQNLFTGGIDKFLSPASQQTQEIDFWQAYAPNQTYVPHSRNQISAEIDFQGSYQLYYEEIFFHIPFLIANQLNANQQFADAQKWYHYIFNPTATAPSTPPNPAVNPNDRYWQYLPFRNQTPKQLLALLTQSDALTVYREDPADPHAIAALRFTTYQKAIVMKYIDNLLDWGDSLFTQDTRESITEATMLYVLAFNLLGPRPKTKPVKQLEEIGTYSDFVQNYEDPIEFLTELEKTAPAGGTAISLSPHAHLITYFCVPENEKFIGYWDLVEDRLYKIRHSLNIEGIFRQLALFQPPIDPAALVQAVAGGSGIGGALADLNGSVPHYRYGPVLEQAKEVTSMVSDLGSAFLSALEAKDDGQLSGLQRIHERNLLNLITTLKQYELAEVKEEIEALKINRQNIEARQEYYRSLVEDGTAGLSLSAAEASAITFKNVVRALKVGSGVATVLEKLAKITPDISVGASGFGGSPLATGTLKGENLAAGFEAQAAIVDVVAEGLDIATELSQDIGEYQRRLEDWKQEKKTAEFDLQELDLQLLVAQTRLQRTEFEQLMHDKELQQNQEVADFFRSKFTNGELRSWMVSRLSGLYFQAYKLAYDLAKAAEKALQFELPTTQTFITPGHWDSLKKGLLAGESLLLELNRMDKVRLDQDSRFQDIEKTISMRRTFPEALEILKQTGLCELSLGERLFNLDFPGHYCRLIKTLAISVIPDDKIAPGGKIDPYDAVHATLSQTGNKTLLVPDSNAVGYLMGLGDEQPDTSTLRVNWRANQQIAISKPSEDLGMFNLDFIFDDRYFPFEGTGAVSTWRLEMPPENNPALMNGNANQLQITDVIIHLRYTSKFDRGAFKKAVQELMKQVDRA
ncbi:MAG: neuraminidase-like domain-containing protein [Cyanobacteria bacterium P01_A01_bin.114]